MLSPDVRNETSASNNPLIEKAEPSQDEIHIDISDALCEKDKVKFTVHTKTKVPIFQENDFNVSRQHEEFIWLHDEFNKNDDYAGIIIPPAPLRPDFDASRAKLQKLSESEGLLTTEEHEKMKQELEAEYLAMFKKTVSMHEVFLQRLAGHPVLRNDHNFRVFLEYKEDLSVRGKNTKEQITGFFKNLTKSAEEVLLSNQKETDEFFEGHKRFLLTYNGKVKDATAAADRATRSQKNVAENYIKLSSALNSLSTLEKNEMPKYYLIVTDFFEKIRKSDSRIQSDIDLKLSDTLRYYMRESKAALDLMHRLSKCLADFESANKNLDKTRQKNKDLVQAEAAQQSVKNKFETMSEKAREELSNFKARRVQMFRKGLTELTELQIKHTKTQIQTIKDTLQQIQRL